MFWETFLGWHSVELRRVHCDAEKEIVLTSAAKHVYRAGIYAAGQYAAGCWRGIGVPVVDTTTIYWEVKDEDGTAAADGEATITLWLIEPPADDGFAYSTAARTATSSGGEIEFANCFKGATYLARLGSTGRETRIVIPTDAADRHAMGEILGVI